MLKGLIDTGVPTDAMDQYSRTAIDGMIDQIEMIPSTDYHNDYPSTIATHFSTLIGSGATVSERSIRDYYGLPRSLKILQHIGRSEGGMEGEPGYPCV